MLDRPYLSMLYLLNKNYRQSFLTLDGVLLYFLDNRNISSNRTYAIPRVSTKYASMKAHTSKYQSGQIGE